MGYIFLQMLPPLRFHSLQTGFVPGAQAADGVYIIKRVAELSREWKKDLFVVQLDLSKAFDRVKHSAAIRALKLQSATPQCIALFCSLMMRSTMAFTLGGVQSLSVILERGLPQGAPESPLLFVMITGLVLRPLLARWRDRGSGWTMDSLFVGAVCYADDIVLLSSRKEDLHQMIQEVIHGFGEVGLSIGAAKTHWTSLPSMPGETLEVLDVQVRWEPDFTFIGTVIDLLGSDAKAIDHRIAQATKSWGQWKGLTVCRNISPMKRCWLVYRAVFASLLWMSQCWVPTQAQSCKLNSWGARLLGRTYGVKRRVQDGLGDHWKRLHRSGHMLYERLGANLETLRRRTKFRWAGHLARCDSGVLRLALRTRCLSWWRFFQHPTLPLHRGRFGKPVRWEAELEDAFGKASTDNPMAQSVGWMTAAMDRECWKAYVSGLV